MSFDTLAPHYRWMEWLLAGEKLQRCRVAFLQEVQHAHNVLLLGEGNGRFLSSFAQVNCSARITVVDASEGMLQQARRRVTKLAPKDSGRINFVHANAVTWSPPAAQFDLIVTNFFFDCFRADQLAVLVPRLASGAAPNAQWLVSDFRIPSRGFAHWRARWIVAVMYRFFRIVTKLPATSLTSIDPLLRSENFELRDRRLSEWGLLHTDLWQRIQH